MKKTEKASEIPFLLKMLEEGFFKKAWHGPNLRGSLRGVTPEEAAWRPSPPRHNIWEIAVHAAYWKYVVRRRLLGEKRGSFPLRGSNWFVRPIETSEKAWREDLALLDEAHRKLCQVVAVMKNRDLNYAPSASKIDNRTLISGIASHDIYHAGQIQLLKRLRR
jgi:hypothetical protein